MSVLHALVYLSVLIFVVACFARGLKIARTPMHLRWELQPVPHERPGKSMFEQVDWWEHSRDKNHFGELGIMIPEILLLKGVWEHNRGLWFPSWALHFGLYLLIGNMALILLLTILLLAGIAQSGMVVNVMVGLIRTLSFIGGGLGVIGAVLMFFKRAFDKDMSKYATPSHYFNIILLGAIFASTVLWAFADHGYISRVTGLYAGVLTASPIPAFTTTGYLNVAVVLLFFIYLPFTHMTHFFTKYFTYHTIRWEDQPNTKGSKVEQNIVKNVTQPVSWASEHIGADGKKTWVDLAAGTGEVKQDEKKEA